MRCELCGEHVMVADTLEHFRLMHPDMDAIPETWPDGGVVVHEVSKDYATPAEVIS